MRPLRIWTTSEASRPLRVGNHPHRLSVSGRGPARPLALRKLDLVGAMGPSGNAQSVGRLWVFPGNPISSGSTRERLAARSRAVGPSQLIARLLREGCQTNESPASGDVRPLTVLQRDPLVVAAPLEISRGATARGQASGVCLGGFASVRQASPPLG